MEELINRKKPKTAITDRLREVIWMMHHGVHEKDATCLVCGQNKLSFRTKGSWEAAHIVAETFAMDPLSEFSILPCCPTCNSETRTKCIFEVLWDRGRMDAIRKICQSIYLAYNQRKEPCDRVPILWILIKQLYGFKKHAAGGGIPMYLEQPIYEILSLYQIHILNEEVVSLSRELQERVKLMETIMIKGKFTWYNLSKDERGIIYRKLHPTDWEIWRVAHNSQYRPNLDIEYIVGNGYMDIIAWIDDEICHCAAKYQPLEILEWLKDIGYQFNIYGKLIFIHCSNCNKPFYIAIL
jgi:transcription elongation factor Elf1